MEQQIIELNCPGCNARVTTGQKECEWCHKPIIISTFNSVYTMSVPEASKYAAAYRNALAENPGHGELNRSAAMCYLKLGLYEKALPAFEKAMEDNFDDSEPFFYAAVCLLKGKKAFLTPRESINRIEEYINAALAIEPKGIYYYFHAYIKFDYFQRKGFKTEPTYRMLLNMAEEAGVSEWDKEQLFAILKVARPDDFK